MKLPAASLTIKITVLIVIVLIVGFGISTILTIQRESDLLVEQSKGAARRLTMTLIASIESAMLQERPDITRGLIQEMQSTTPVEGLTIYRHNGVEAFTDLETLKAVSKEAELPKGVAASIEKMARPAGAVMTGPLFKKAVDTLQTQESLEEQNGVPLFTLHQPIPNQERCQGCHGTDHKVRAVVRVQTSMAPVFAAAQSPDHGRHRHHHRGGRRPCPRDALRGGAPHPEPGPGGEAHRRGRFRGSRARRLR